LRLLTLALLATFCVAGVARADCGGGQEICWDDRFGLPPVADYAAEGDEVIRLHVESFGQKDVVYQLVRRPSDGSVWLDARADFDPLRTIFYPMSSDVWPKAVARWTQFVKDEDAYRARVASGKENHTHTDPVTHITTETVCTDGMGVEVETYFSGGKAQSSFPSGCFDDAPISFVADFRSLTLQSIPFCSDLDVYNACFLLEGNKYEAASAAVGFFSLNGSSGTPLSRRNCFSALDRPVPESRAAQVQSLICPSDGSNDATFIEGQNGRVLISGTASRWNRASNSLSSAPFHEVWQRDSRGKFKLAKWDFGVFKNR